MAQKPRIFRLFVSSTFSDMVVERNLLQARVFPSLKLFCEAHEARFQAIDLRWGISQEAGLTQRATDLCLNEIARCQRMTRRPNFLLLLGDRYGWQPLPNDIPADEWDVLAERISTNELSELFAWYKRDNNAVPPLYVLQPRQGTYINQDTWNTMEKHLREILRNALHGLDWSHDRRMKYEASVTEQEIDAGIFQYAAAQEGTLCFFRTIDGLAAANTRYWDDNLEAQARLADLKHRLEARLSDNIHCYPAQAAGDDITLDEDAFCSAVEFSLRQMIEAELESFEHVSPLEIEFEAHRTFMIDHTRHFVGRVHVLDTVSRYLTSGDRHPLVLHGQSGVGKSTVMAKAIESASHTLYRFIGTTPESSDIRSVLVSLCQSIRMRYGVTDDVPHDYEELIKAFPTFLAQATAEKPLIIFLDALDQFANTNTPSNLRWLPNRLPPYVKLVMSVIPSPHLDALKRRLPSKSLVEVVPMQAADGEALLEMLLRSIGRTLQPPQRAEVMGKFVLNGLPLYLKLAFEEARLWHSYCADFTLHPNVSSLLENNLFARLSRESEHGAILVSRSMAYLAASRNGLSEGEMIEVLTKDTGFWDDFEKKRTHEAQREALKSLAQLPIAVWSRLALDLEPYLVECGADGTVLLNFYHRQFSETVERLFLASQREKYHEHLAEYFKKQDIRSGNVPNARKVSEQAYQQAKANLHDEYVETLTRFPFLQAALNVRGTEALIEDCGFMQNAAVGLIQSALTLSEHILKENDRQLPIQLSGRLASHKNNVKIASLLETIQPSYPSLIAVNSVFRNQAGDVLTRTLAGHGSSVWYVALTEDGRAVSASHDCTLRVWDLASGSLLHTLVGEDFWVICVSLLGDKQAISSYARDSRACGHTGVLTVFDLNSGERLYDLVGHTREVWYITLTEDGRAVSASGDKTLRVWDVGSGTLLL